jgi:hypothetical protein
MDQRVFMCAGCLVVLNKAYDLKRKVWIADERFFQQQPPMSADQEVCRVCLTPKSVSSLTPILDEHGKLTVLRRLYEVSSFKVNFYPKYLRSSIFFLLLSILTLNTLVVL